MLTKIFKLLQKSKKVKSDLEQIKKPNKTEYLKPVYTKIQKPSYYGLCGIKTEYNVIWPIRVTDGFLHVTDGFSVSEYGKDMDILHYIISWCGDYIYYAEKGSQVISEDEYDKGVGNATNN